MKIDKELLFLLRNCYCGIIHLGKMYSYVPWTLIYYNALRVCLFFFNRFFGFVFQFRYQTVETEAVTNRSRSKACYCLVHSVCELVFQRIKMHKSLCDGYQLCVTHSGRIENFHSSLNLLHMCLLLIIGLIGFIECR